MEPKKVVIFLINGNPVKKLDADSITENEVEGTKCSLAIIHSVPYDEIEAVTEYDFGLEVSDTLIIRSDGKLFARGGANMFFKEVHGVKPAMDTTKEELFYEFLDHIALKEFDKALIFS